MEKWTETITIDMLPEQYQPLADVIGVQQLLALAEKQGGSNMYIPKLEALVRTTRDRQIKEKFNGYNAEELARCYAGYRKSARTARRPDRLPWTIFGAGKQGESEELLHLYPTK